VVNPYGLPFECCVSNGNQGWPKFTSHSYAAYGDGELAVLLYAPSQLATTLKFANGKSNKVSISLDTSYPFAEELRFTINAEKAFVLWLRIPGWASRATVKMGSLNEAAPAGSFYKLSVPAGQNTAVSLTFPFDIKIKQEPAGGVSVHAGPLLFALDMAPDEVKSKDCYFPPDGCNDPDIRPTVDWKSALMLDRGPATGGLKIDFPTEADLAASKQPFQRLSPLPRIHATGIKLSDQDWASVNCTSMESHCANCAGPVPRNVSKSTSTEAITLIPFGATDIRMAVLPALWSDGSMDIPTYV